MSLRIIRHSLLTNPLALIGLILFASLIAMANAAPLLTPYDLEESFRPMLKPSSEHLLGTNDLGYDLWTELLYGARTSLTLGLSAATLSCVLGLLAGGLAGFSRTAGAVLMRLIDIMLAIPRFPLVILMAAFIRPNLSSLALFFVIFGWPSVARIVSATIRAESQAEHVLAARALGASRGRILIRHLLPSAIPVTLTRWVAEVQHIIMAEAGLSFLGLGDPTLRTWGMTLSHARRYAALWISDVWTWWVLPPGIAIAAVCLSLVMIGLGLDQIANPEMA